MNNKNIINNEHIFFLIVQSRTVCPFFHRFMSLFLHISAPNICTHQALIQVCGDVDEIFIHTEGKKYVSCFYTSCFRRGSRFMFGYSTSHEKSTGRGNYSWLSIRLSCVNFDVNEIEGWEVLS